MHTQDVENFKNVLRRIRDTKVAMTLTYRLRGKGNHGYRLIEDIVTPEFDNKAIRYIGSALDITDQRRISDSPSDKETFFYDIFENASIGIYRTTPDGRVLFANPAMFRFLGFNSLEELSEYNFEKKNIFWQNTLARNSVNILVKRDTYLVLREREDEKTEAYCGLEKIRGWSMTKTTMWHIMKELLKTFPIESKAEDALRQSEAELRALLNSMKAVILVIDKDGRYLKSMSESSLLDRPVSEIIGKTCHELYPKEKADFFLSTIRRALESGEPQTVEHTMVIRGEERYRLVTVTKLTPDNVLWVSQDITELKIEQKEIEESERKYRELVENSLVGVLRMNLGGHITYTNKAMVEMLGYFSPQELMSVNPLDLFENASEREKLLNELRINGKTEKNREIKLVTKSGTVKTVLISASSDGMVMSAMVKDITEIRLLEQEFLQTQKLEGLGNIAAGIAHDFNNLLGIIMGYSDLLMQSDYEPEKFDRAIRAISKATDRGKSLVKQLLTFARKTATNFSNLSVNDTVAEIERLLAETFPKTIEIHTELQKNIPNVLADSTQIHQVLLNLCVNARDAMQRGGELSISTRTVEGNSLYLKHPEALNTEYVLIQVRDNGIGMNNETRDHIFEPFFTTKGIGKGTGLGLAVVYGIVESHRGFVDVASKLSAGTTVSVYLPVQQKLVEHAESTIDRLPLI